MSGSRAPPAWPVLAVLVACAGPLKRQPRVSRPALPASAAPHAKKSALASPPIPCPTSPTDPEWAMVDPSLVAGSYGSIFHKQPAPVVAPAKYSFCMRRREVTVRMYKSCHSAGLCNDQLMDEDLKWIGGCTHYDYRLEPDEMPMRCLDWSHAAIYCEFSQGRLPKYSEWLAAYGYGPWPWGDEPDPSDESKIDPLCWSGGLRHRIRPCVATEMQRFQSPFGIFDLIGNVSEFVLDNKTLVVGGSYESAIVPEVSPSHPLIWTTGLPSSSVGFRCVRTAGPLLPEASGTEAN